MSGQDIIELRRGWVLGGLPLNLLLVLWQILCESHVGLTLCGRVGVGVV